MPSLFMRSRGVLRLFCVLLAAGTLLLSVALFTFRGSYESSRELPVDSVVFQNGDLVFILGKTWRSSVVRFFDTEDYSHVGIIRFVYGVPKVIHAEPNTSIVRIESVEDFLSPSNARRAGVYRLRSDRFAKIAEAASLEALGYFERRVPFDHRFDILCNNKLYCTELVWLAYKHAGIDLGEGEADFLHDSALFGKVLLPGRLSRSAHLIKIF